MRLREIEIQMFENGDNLIHRDGFVYTFISYLDSFGGLEIDCMACRVAEMHSGGTIRYCDSTQMWFHEGRHVLTEATRVMK